MTYKELFAFLFGLVLFMAIMLFLINHNDNQAAVVDFIELPIPVTINPDLK